MGCKGAKEVRVFGISLWQNAEAAECARNDRIKRQNQRQDSHSENVEVRQEEHSERTDTRQTEKSERVLTRGKYGTSAADALGNVGKGLGAGAGGALCALTGIGCPSDTSGGGSSLTGPILAIGGIAALGGLAYVALKAV